MSVSGGIITAPIYAEDPYNLLGVPKQPSGYDLAFINGNKHGRTNKWAKYKPVSINKISPLDDTDIINTNCGIINTSYFQRLLYMAQNVVNGQPLPVIGLKEEYWSYDKPTSYYRLSDFNKYWHRAVNPIGDINSTFIEVSINPNAYRIIFQLAPDDGMNVRLNDLKIVDNDKGLVRRCSDMYFGVCLTNGTSSGTGSWFITQLTKVSQIYQYGAYVDITDGLDTIGNWTCFAFLSDRQLPLMRDDSNIGIYAPLSFTKVNIVVKEKIPALSIIIFQAAVFDRTIKVDFDLVNKDDISYNTSAIVIEILNLMGVVLLTKSLLSTIINPNSSKTFTHTFTSVGLSTINNADRVKISFTASNKIFIQQAGIMKNQ